MPQPWKKTTSFVASGGAAWRLAQRWNVVPANFGSAASLWMPRSFCASTLSGLLASVQFARGATGVPSAPSLSGRPRSWLRSGTPSASASLALARVLISAMCTPCGQTFVQMPQLEQ